MIVNLGIGILLFVLNYLFEDINVMFYVENGIVGMGLMLSKGNEDENLCNVVGLLIFFIIGVSYFDSCIVFGMI